MKTRITELYGIEHPIPSGAMAFVSLPPLVAAVSEAGGPASLANGSLPPDGLRALIRATRSLTSRPFAVHFITQFASNDHIDVCLAEELPFVEFFWTHPTDTYSKRLKEQGVLVAMKVAKEHEGRGRKTPPQPEPPVSIGRTMLGPNQDEMPKHSALFSTSDTEGDCEELCLTAGWCSPPIHEVKPVAQIIRSVVRKTETLLKQRPPGLAS